MMEWIQNHPLALGGLVVWAAGLLWLMPGTHVKVSRPVVPGLVLSAVGIVLLCLSVGRPQPEFADEVLFWLFGGGSLICGVLMITSKNPVYGALWFALATLCTCGLFLLRSAPFLAAATVIVYAGAVIVTFLFVIMLAQQGGAVAYDQKSSHSVIAILASFVLLGGITMAIQSQGEQPEPLSAEQVPAGNPLSIATAEQPVGQLKGLGKSLFGDYLFAVELAGTLLLIASVGAIAIAPRREQGTL